MRRGRADGGREGVARPTSVHPAGGSFGTRLAAIDRLVHHATILEMNVESYRRKAALRRKRGLGD